jgi:hypothetical protein
MWFCLVIWQSLGTETEASECVYYYSQYSMEYFVAVDLAIRELSGNLFGMRRQRYLETNAAVQVLLLAIGINPKAQSCTCRYTVLGILKDRHSSSCATA